MYPHELALSFPFFSHASHLSEHRQLCPANLSSKKDGSPVGPAPIGHVGITVPTPDNNGKPDLLELTVASLGSSQWQLLLMSPSGGSNPVPAPELPEV